MLKKTITYKNVDGKEITEDFYFHMSKAELAEMELSQKGGMAAHFKTIVDEGDGSAIMATFKMILLSAYGQRSEDGRRFIKSKELSDEFTQTEAYSQLFMELVTDANAGAEFVKGIMPADLSIRTTEQLELPIDTKPQDDLLVKNVTGLTVEDLAQRIRRELQEGN